MEVSNIQILWGLIGLLVTGLGWVLAFFMRRLVTDVAALWDELDAVKQSLGRDYAQRRDVDSMEGRLTAAMQELKGSMERGLERIYHELASKADK